MLRITNFKMGLCESPTELKKRLERHIGVRVEKCEIVRRSVDARRKNDVRYVVSVDFETADEEKILAKKISGVAAVDDKEYVFPPAAARKSRPVIVGAGPAGLFCALFLARAGLRPILAERGAPVDERTAAVEKFWAGGALSETTNVQFGEGGAGTFSDGKLNTGTHDVRIRTVLEEFVRHGAPRDILVNAKPHIGTDILRSVVKSMREEIISLGGEVRFYTKLTDFETTNGRITAAIFGDEKIPTDSLVLAIGHSARDTVRMLYRRGVAMQSKAFSVGVRIEHRQEDISRAMYGDAVQFLPAADYKAAVHLAGGRSVYTFCMCPGGYVVAAASVEKSVVTNGMSLSARDGENANSALLVGITPADFGTASPLCGIEFQEKIERAAYAATGGYFAPAQTVGSFLGTGENRLGRVVPTYRPGVKLCQISDVLPEFVCAALRDGIVLLDRKIRGFAATDAVLTAPETRSSSPVSFLRSADCELSVGGLYCAGEGGGHAGGITSSAVDGIRAAQSIAQNPSPTN